MTFWSLILGIVAWMIGVITIWKRSVAGMFAGLSLTLVAALLPLYDLRRYLYSGDCGGAEDIIGGILFGEIVLIAVTILLNLAALLRMKK